MALIEAPLIVDDMLWGSTGVLEKIGDVFHEHVHTDADNHITVLSQGTVRLLGKYAGKQVSAPRVLIWTAGEPHGWIAETDGVWWVNIRKHRRAWTG
jgi:quercetin dioxygenase-like cupin family protein